MKKIHYILLILSLTLFSCNQEDSLMNEKEKSIDVKQHVANFMKIDDAFYNQICKDSDFEDLCRDYNKLKNKVISDTTKNNLQNNIYAADNIFKSTDALIKKYKRDNIFSYVLHHIKLNLSTSRSLSHAWGNCHLGLDGIVCNTYRYWQEAWSECSLLETLANNHLQSRLDIHAYRQTQYNFLKYYSHDTYDRSELYHAYTGSYDIYTAGDYSRAMYDNLNNIINNIYLWYNYRYQNQEICLLITRLKLDFMNFYISRIWESCISPTGDTDTPNMGGGSGTANPEIDPQLESNPYLDCAFSKVMATPSFKDIVNQFMGENCIAHLRWELSTDLADNVSGEFITEMNHYWFTIKLNETRLMNSPLLIVAGTIIHEAIHANIYAKLMSLKESPPSSMLDADLALLKNELNNQNFPGLYYFYGKYIDDATAQHEYMAEYQVRVISGILQEIDPTMPELICRAIAWRGLRVIETIENNEIVEVESEAWKSLSEEEKVMINAAYNHYFEIASWGCNK